MTGDVDGGWWPRSRDLGAELPPLIAAVCKRIGRVEMVRYQLSEWQRVPRKMTIDGATVHLAGYRLQRPARVQLIANNRRLTLTVVDPARAEQTAKDILTAAAESDSIEDIPSLLAHTHPGEFAK